MTGWTYVCTVASESERGKTYDIKRRDGVLGCDCVAYRFAKKEAKTCKHIRAMLGLAASGLAATIPNIPNTATVVTHDGETYRVTRRAVAFGGIG